MREDEHMNYSSTRGFFLSAVLLFLFSITFMPNGYTEEILTTSSSSSVVPTENSDFETSEISVKSNSFEETTVIEFTNIEGQEIDSFQIWLGGDFNFKSFKTERGWLGEKTLQETIVFTSSESVKPGESVKIGIKTNLPNPEVNWKALGKNQNELGSGQTVPAALTKAVPIIEKSGNGVLDDSAFRIIPEHPSAGDKIRVTGDNFAANHQFDFFVGLQKVGTFVTNGEGYFMTTMEIPHNQLPERVDLTVKDLIGNEKKISLRIGDVESNIPPTDFVKLSIRGIPDIMQIGELLEISGTANPNSVVTGTIKNPEGMIINTRTASVDAKGDWKLDEPILVALDSMLGRYSAEITDGRETISKDWIIESSKIITITPIKLKFSPGEVMKFNGTAQPNIPIDLRLEGPLGVERSSDIIQVDNTGVVYFEYATTANVDKEGTWTLIAIQDDNKEFIYAGLGELPSIPIRIEFDKLNYKTGETAIISLTGKPGDIVSMLIIDSSDKPKGDAVSITLEDDGKTTYSLPLKGYSSGIYTAAISKGNSKSTEIFAVGLQTGSGEIKISTTKLEYKPNDPVLILGEANKNVVINFSLIDPNDKKVKEIESFTDKEGKISEDGFRIPSEAEPGTWKINAKSGSNYKTIEIEVNASEEEGMVISVGEGIKNGPPLGKYIDIKVINAVHTVEFKILGPDGELVDELSFPANESGEIKLPWAILPDLVPGTYTITAKDGHNNAETTFQLTP